MLMLEVPNDQSQLATRFTLQPHYYADCWEWLPGRPTIKGHWVCGPCRSFAYVCHTLFLDMLCGLTCIWRDMFTSLSYHTSGMPHSYEPLPLLFTSVTRLVYIKGRMDIHGRSLWSICVTYLIHTCDVTRSYVWHDSFICVTWHIQMCDVTHSYMCHILSMCVIWLTSGSGHSASRSYASCDSCVCVT